MNGFVNKEQIVKGHKNQNSYVPLTEDPVALWKD